jgi:hypothetical protein
MSYINLNIEVTEDEIYDELSDASLKEECIRRGLMDRCGNLTKNELHRKIEKIFEARRNKLDYQKLLDDLIYHTIGRIS